MLSCLFWLCWNWYNRYLQSMEFSLHCHRCPDGLSLHNLVCIVILSESVTLERWGPIRSSVHLIWGCNGNSSDAGSRTIGVITKVMFINPILELDEFRCVSISLSSILHTCGCAWAVMKQAIFTVIWIWWFGTAQKVSRRKQCIRCRVGCTVGYYG